MTSHSEFGGVLGIQGNTNAKAVDKCILSGYEYTQG